MPCERDMRPAVDAWLEARGMGVTHEKTMYHAVDVIGVLFAPRTSRRIPAVEKIVAVELKLTDVAGVIRQAVANRICSNESYAAMPGPRVKKMQGRTRDKFRKAGVGLLSVDGGKVWCVIDSGPRNTTIDAGDWRVRTLHKRLWGHLHKLYPWPPILSTMATMTALDDQGSFHCGHCGKYANQDDLEDMSGPVSETCIIDVAPMCGKCRKARKDGEA